MSNFMIGYCIFAYALHLGLTLLTCVAEKDVDLWDVLWLAIAPLSIPVYTLVFLGSRRN